jgi:hypothetical protein
MRKAVWAIWSACGLWAGGAAAQAAPIAWPAAEAAATGPSLVPPVFLALVDEPQNVYPEIMPPRAEESMNSGGVNFGLNIDWVTDYVYRGVVQATVPHTDENALQFDANAKFNLGKLPHPFIGLFVNVFNDDPVSRFEEVRPYFGLEWTLKPLVVSGGFISYIHPNRKNLDTQEVFLSITLDDARVFHTARPIFSPYVYGAYDFDLYNGFYLEAGLKHDFVFEDIGLTLTPKGDIAYVVNQTNFVVMPGGKDYGLQHYDLGMVGSLSLNHMFNVNRRYGEWSVKGYIYYTAGIDRHLRADTLIWGGIGLEFKY